MLFVEGVAHPVHIISHLYFSIIIISLVIQDILLTHELCMISHYPDSLVPRPCPSDAAAGGGDGQRESTYCLYHLVLK